MRIAMIHFTAAPIIGGVERVMDEHARLFAAHGHEVTIVCGSGGGGSAMLLPADRSAEAQARALRPVLAAQEIVIVHNVMTMPFHPGLTEALWRLAAELPRVRFVAWVHDVAARNPDYGGTPPILRTAHPRFEYVAVSPLRMRDFRRVTHEPGLPCRVVPNGVDPARVLGLPPNVADFAEAHRLLDGRLVLFHPARLLPRKGIRTSLCVAKEFRMRHVPAKVLITGAMDPHGSCEGSGMAALCRGFQKERGHVFVNEHLEVGDAELAGLYRLADALFFPSRREGFGLPLIEAALHGLPVFCSDIDPLRDLLRDNVTFFPHDAKAPQIATLVLEMLEASRAFRERKRVLREFAWESIYRGHLAPLLSSP